MLLLLETVYCLNVGRATVANADDTRMFQTSGNGIPMYRDYVMLIPSEGSSKQTPCLALHLSEEVGSKFVDAILNNLEIFRLKKSNGSLAMPNPKSSSSLVSLKPENKQPKKGKKLSMNIVIGVSLGCTKKINGTKKSFTITRPTMQVFYIG
ncbi:hypothetical protein Gorai_020849 [Gossypium raimondii]|uniref:Uncharacterized protein n=1 Tax=Gossypium raimondii TaxID=29730 RepID=A0A7J8NNK4_GOSRA|nr:hypothetical protein [Gossypium raimondii]